MNKSVTIISKDDMIKRTSFKHLKSSESDELLMEKEVMDYISDSIDDFGLIPTFEFLDNDTRIFLCSKLDKLGFQYTINDKDKLIILDMDIDKYEKGTYPYDSCKSLYLTRDYVRNQINDDIETRMNLGWDHIAIRPVSMLYIKSFFFDQWLTKELEEKGYTVSTGTDIGPNSFSSYKISW